MKTTTTTGTEVTLTPKISNLDHPVVHADFRHPKAGQIDLDLAGYGVIRGKDGAYGHYRGQRVLLQIPREDYDAAMAEARDLIVAEIEKIRSGETRIELSWREGSPLSGYVTTTRFADDLLKEIGIAKDVNGWGTLVDQEAVKVLGEWFTFAEAMAYTQPARDEAAAKVMNTEARRTECQAKAARIDKPAELRRWTEPCSDPEEECSFDLCIEYVDADGETVVRRSHTW